MEGKIYGLEEVETMLKGIAVEKKEPKKRNMPKEMVKNEDWKIYSKFNSKKLIELVNTLRPGPNSQYELILKKLQRYINEKFEGELNQFGSNVNGFGLKKMDMDLCFVTREQDREKVIIQMGEHFKNNKEFSVLHVLQNTRIPIIKLRHKRTQIMADIGINNCLALRNSLLLREYCRVDERVQILGLAIKHWSKNRKMNDPYIGTLSSYCLNIMLIYFLQLKKVVPNLQDNAPSHMIDGFDTGFNTNVDWKSPNNENVFDLFISFFNFFANSFNYNDEVLSIRKLVTREEKEWTRKISNGKYWLCVEDPFELTHNLARNVTKDDLYDIRGEFMRIGGLTKKKLSLQKLLAVYNPNNSFERIRKKVNLDKEQMAELKEQRALEKELRIKKREAEKKKEEEKENAQ